MTNKSYSFSSDTEPTDEQLAELMSAVSEDVKARAAIATKKCEDLQRQLIKEAFEKRKLQKESNGQE